MSKTTTNKTATTKTNLINIEEHKQEIASINFQMKERLESLMYYTQGKRDTAYECADEVCDRDKILSFIIEEADRTIALYKDRNDIYCLNDVLRITLENVRNKANEYLIGATSVDIEKYGYNKDRFTPEQFAFYFCMDDLSNIAELIVDYKDKI